MNQISRVAQTSPFMSAAQFAARSPRAPGFHYDSVNPMLEAVGAKEPGATMRSQTSTAMFAPSTGARRRRDRRYTSLPRNEGRGGRAIRGVF